MKGKSIIESSFPEKRYQRLRVSLNMTIRKLPWSYDLVAFISEISWANPLKNY